MRIGEDRVGAVLADKAFSSPSVDYPRRSGESDAGVVAMRIGEDRVGAVLADKAFSSPKVDYPRLSGMR